MEITYDFIPPGASVQPEPGALFVDVGNACVPGVLDHHQPDAPAACSARLVHDHPELVLAQRVAEQPMRLITHLFPDLDAISAVYFARLLLRGERLDAATANWADDVCDIDRGNTALDPAQPICPYSVAMLRLARARAHASNPLASSARMLEAGLELVDILMERQRAGLALDDPALLVGVAALSEEIRAVAEDRAAYAQDLARAELFAPRLPRQSGSGVMAVPGLWIEQPRAQLFKAWARGDCRLPQRPAGFVFTGIQLSPQRAILSVAPDAGVTLKGLGDQLEEAETAKRARLGQVREGSARPGYHNADPWYDGRSALHGYTIIDAPRAGTVLSAREIRAVFDDFVARQPGSTDSH